MRFMTDWRWVPVLGSRVQTARVDNVLLSTKMRQKSGNETFFQNCGFGVEAISKLYQRYKFPTYAVLYQVVQWSTEETPESEKSDSLKTQTVKWRCVIISSSCVS